MADVKQRQSHASHQHNRTLRSSASSRTPASDMAHSSTLVHNQSSSTLTPMSLHSNKNNSQPVSRSSNSNPYTYWDDQANMLLLSIIEDNNYYAHWLAASNKGRPVSPTANHKTKNQISEEISVEMTNRGIPKDPRQIAAKVKWFEQKYRKALEVAAEHVILKDHDGKAFNELLERECPHFARVDAIMGPVLSAANGRGDSSGPYDDDERSNGTRDGRGAIDIDHERYDNQDRSNNREITYANYDSPSSTPAPSNPSQRGHPTHPSHYQQYEQSHSQQGHHQVPQPQQMEATQEYQQHPQHYDQQSRRYEQQQQQYDQYQTHQQRLEHAHYQNQKARPPYAVNDTQSVRPHPQRHAGDQSHHHAHQQQLPEHGGHPRNARNGQVGPRTPAAAPLPLKAPTRILHSHPKPASGPMRQGEPMPVQSPAQVPTQNVRPNQPNGMHQLRPPVQPTRRGPPQQFQGQHPAQAQGGQMLPPGNPSHSGRSITYEDTSQYLPVSTYENPATSSSRAHPSSAPPFPHAQPRPTTLEAPFAPTAGSPTQKRTRSDSSPNSISPAAVPMVANKRPRLTPNGTTLVDGSESASTVLQTLQTLLELERTRLAVAQIEAENQKARFDAEMAIARRRLEVQELAIQVQAEEAAVRRMESEERRWIFEAWRRREEIGVNMEDEQQVVQAEVDVAKEGKMAVVEAVGEEAEKADS
ncbi:hypothetical protein BJ742DRAFT_851707 [Cladochytrium replicatum]|nr:hypothetical protein BJ742DRAFT_851707 [Cladochytrium replicatum]